MLRKIWIRNIKRIWMIPIKKFRNWSSNLTFHSQRFWIFIWLSENCRLYFVKIAKPCKVHMLTNSTYQRLRNNYELQWPNGNLWYWQWHCQLSMNDRDTSLYHQQRPWLSIIWAWISHKRSEMNILGLPESLMLKVSDFLQA
jgi:hypothetical protein